VAQSSTHRPGIPGLVVTAGGLAATILGFGIFGAGATDPAASGWWDFALVVAILVGAALVEVGSWLNASFYRALEESALRPVVEGLGAVALVAGVIVLGNCLALYWMGSSGLPLVGVAIGVVLMEVGLAAEHRTVIRACTSPSFPLTMIVVGAGVLGLAALTFISMINVRHYARLDLTERGFYRLDDQTVKILESIKKPLRIISTMVQRPGGFGPEEFRNFVRERTAEMLDEYASRSPNVEHIRLNPYANPERADQIEQELKIELRVDSVVFAYEGKTKVVEFSEILTEPGFGQEAPQFKGEEVFTSALQELVEGKTTKVYFVVGHGERDINDYDRDGASALADLLRKDNCEVKTCELRDLPDDCDVLVIAGPKTPLSSADVDAVREFLDKEGSAALFLLDPVSGEVGPSGLEDLLQERGVKVENDQTLVEVARHEVLPGIISTGPTVRIETTEYGGGPAMMMGPPHPVIRDLKTTRTVYYLACPVSSTTPPRPSPYGPPQGDPFTAELVKTSSRTYAKSGFDPADLPRLRINPDEDKQGPFTIAIARGKVEGRRQRTPPMSPPPAGKFVVFGDSDFITNKYLQRGVVGNATIFRNAVAWVAGKEYKIGIPPKPLQQERTIDMPSDQRTIARWATVFVPPFHILVIGVVVWWLRRR